MTHAYPSYVSAMGRFLLALMFIPAGFSKLANLEGTAAAIASAGLPLPMVAATGAGVFELLGGIALILGWQVRWVGLGMALFTLVASVAFHAFWAVPADQTFVTQLLFMKNLSVAGGMLLISALGAGALSLDARRSRR